MLEEFLAVVSGDDDDGVVGDGGIDGDGIIRVAKYNVRAKGHVDALLRTLDKLDDREWMRQ